MACAPTGGVVGHLPAHNCLDLPRFLADWPRVIPLAIEAWWLVPSPWVILIFVFISFLSGQRENMLHQGGKVERVRFVTTILPNNNEK